MQAADRSSPSAELRVTPVEEEGRALGYRNYSWDRQDASSPPTDTPLTSWVSDTNPPLSNNRPLGVDPDSRYPAVTAVEPRAFPKLGAMLDVRQEILENRSLANQQGSADKEESFVFPLVLPGDWQASPSQTERATKGLLLPGNNEQQPAARGAVHPSSAKEPASSFKPLNRLYVSPRPRELGGGMTVRGAVRKGLAHLRDFQVGVLLADHPTNDAQERDAKL